MGEGAVHLESLTRYTGLARLNLVSPVMRRSLAGDYDSARVSSWPAFTFRVSSTVSCGSPTVVN